MRAGQVDEPFERQAKYRVVWFACHGGRDGSHTMVGVHTCQDLALLRFAFGATKEPQHFDHSVIRLGTGVGVEHFAAAVWGYFDQFLGQHNRLV